MNPEQHDLSATGIDLLAFGAHPDDVDLAIGGTVARLAEQGRKVVIIDLTAGEMGTRGTPEERQQEAREAASILKAKARECLGLPDGSVTQNHESKCAVIRAIRKWRPTLVMAPALADLHPDHQNAGRLVQECCFLAGLEKWRTKEQRPHRPRSLLHYFLHTQHTPDLVVDISEHFERKRQACLAFKSQFHNKDSKEPSTYISSAGFWVWWEARFRHYGNLIGATFGEPFLHDGPLPVPDPVQLFEDYGYYPRAGSFRGEGLVDE